MNDLQLAAIVVALTGLVRARLPKVDRLVIPAVAVALGAALAAIGDPTHWRDALLHGVGVGLSAVGGMTAVGYAGEKVSGALGAGLSAPVPAPTVPAAGDSAPTAPIPSEPEAAPTLPSAGPTTPSDPPIVTDAHPTPTASSPSEGVAAAAAPNTSTAATPSKEG